jgi:hypothetical protein
MLLEDTVTGIAGNFYWNIGSNTVNPAFGGDYNGPCARILAFVNA